MSKIVLLDYYDERNCYHLDPDKKSVEIYKYQSSECARPCGYAAYQSSGLLPVHKKVFLAIYVYTERIRLWINSMEFDLQDPAIQTKRVAIAPYVKEFSVTNNNKTITSIRYTYNDLNGIFPDEPKGDFCTFISYWANHHLNRLRFAYFWIAKSEGRDVENQSFVDEIEEHLQSHDSQDYSKKTEKDE